MVWSQVVKNRRIAGVIHGEPQVRVGKNGIHDGILREIERRLKEEEVIKVRVLKSYLISSGAGVKQIASEVARLVKAEVVTVRGHVFVLRKRATRARYRG